MANHPRIRRVAKWTGLVVCVLIVVAWAVSLRWGFGYGSKRWVMACARGSVAVRITDVFDADGWGMFDATVFADSFWSFHLPRFFSDATIPLTECGIPLWMPLVVTAILTAIMFYRDRRRIPPGYCQKCGYDLTGNESGICPE